MDEEGGMSGGETAHERNAWRDRAVDAEAEVARLKTLWDECEKDNKQLEAEVEKLRRDNDLLREALRNG